jgi:hypothetical protein
MADPTIFKIENGVFGLKVVDTAAVGYAPTWQAPGGKTLTTVAIADYETDSTTWTCQITAGALTASPSTETSSVPATFCAPAREIPTPGQTAYALDISFLQDVNISDGLNAFLFEFDTEEAYVYMGMDGANPPAMIGRVRLQAGTIGGEARSTLAADVSLGLTARPDIEFGNATTSRIVVGSA